MNRVLYSFNWKGEEPPSIQDLEQRFNLKKEDLDPEFGIVLIDPEKLLYSVLLNQEVAAKLQGYEGNLRGPYSNPRIEPMDLQEDE
ncbi:MAG: hypothetical protein IPL46_01740 [Saprospiraceae bacterium]|nr:hypothetical protein [Saprospiraceae bacterium]